jgi:hypothetical protein
MEVSKFGAKLKQLFPSEAAGLDDQLILALPIEDLCRASKIGGKMSQELAENRGEIAKLSQKLRDDQMFLDVLAKGCIARLEV